MKFQQIPDNGQGPLPPGFGDQCVHLYSCHIEPKLGDTIYRAFVGNGAAFERDRPVGPEEFTDGLANTILVVEASEPVNWASTDDFEYDPSKPLPKLGYF